MKYFVDDQGLAEASPEKIRAQARQLTTVATTIDTVAGMLQKVSTRGAWESPAGDAFAAKVGSTPSDLFDVANRLRTTAQIVRPYADQLEASRTAVADCDTEAHTAHTTMKDKDAELEAMSPDDPDRDRVQRDRGQAARDLSRAERRFETETKEARADESRMAAKLYDVCEQAEDPVLYDYLEFMTNAGQSASDVGILAKPVALAGIAEPIGLAGRRAVYDEGSYSAVAKSSARYGLDTVTFGAGRVVSRAKQRFVDKEVSRVPGLDSNPVRIKDNPITSSTRASRSTKAASASRPTGRYPKKKHYEPVPSKVPASVRDITRRKSGLDDVKEAFDDWEMVAGEGRVAKVAVAVQQTTKQVGRGRRHAATTKTLADRQGMTEGAQGQERRRRRQGSTADRVTKGDSSVDDLVTTPIGPGDESSGR